MIERDREKQKKKKNEFNLEYFDRKYTKRSANRKPQEIILHI